MKTIAWKPKIEQEKSILNSEIIGRLSKRYLGGNGTLTGIVELKGVDLHYLQGMKDFGTRPVATSAKTLIDALKQHGTVEVIIE